MAQKFISKDLVKIKAEYAQMKHKIKSQMTESQEKDEAIHDIN